MLAISALIANEYGVMQPINNKSIKLAHCIIQLSKRQAKQMANNSIHL